MAKIPLRENADAEYPAVADMPGLALSHLGFTPGSCKQVSYVPPPGVDFPDRVRYFVRPNAQPLPRQRPVQGGERFPSPYHQDRGEIIDTPGLYNYCGELVRRDTAWGSFWQADFSDLIDPGAYQIETDHAVSPPFMIAPWVCDRIGRSFLNYLRSQRSGCDTPGIRPAANLDDGRRDDTGEPWPAMGGWYNAGDMRKWLSLTQLNVWALCELIDRGHPGLVEVAREEAAWGSRYFQSMCTDEGQVFEDTAGGAVPDGFDPDRDWWYENLPGVVANASDNRWSDNQLNSGDERTVRTSYNPLVQFLFVQTQAQLARRLPDAEGMRCRLLAERAWRYGRRRGHDGRTLFIAQELLAGVELARFTHASVGPDQLEPLARTLLDRQQIPIDKGLFGYFLEAETVDGYRSAAYPCHPALALLSFAETFGQTFPAVAEAIGTSLQQWADGYALPEIHSNPFGLTAYGVYIEPPHPDLQSFRDAGLGRGVRTFMHPHNRLGVTHGTSSVLAGNAYLLAKLGHYLSRLDLISAAERQLHWLFGHNPLNRSLHSGIGYRQPAGYGYRVTQLPDAMIVGFIGHPDDSPFLEESFAIAWNTLEYWDVPQAWATAASVWLR